MIDTVVYNVYPSLQINDAGKIKNSDIAKELSLPPVKLHCSSELAYFLYWYSFYCACTYPIDIENADLCVEFGCMEKKEL